MHPSHYFCNAFVEMAWPGLSGVDVCSRLSIKMRRFEKSIDGYSRLSLPGVNKDFLLPACFLSATYPWI
jgi:hypothetical protein